MDQIHFLFREDGEIKTYKNDQWLTLDQDTQISELFDQYGIYDLDHIPKEYWENGEIEILMFTPNEFQYSIEAKSDPYTPIDFFNNPSFYTKAMHEDGSINIDASPCNQLIISKWEIDIQTLFPVKEVHNLSVNVTQHQHVKIAIAFNGEESYWTYHNNQWIIIDHDDIENTKKLLNDYGLSPQNLNGISSESWSEKFGDRPKSFRLLMSISPDLNEDTKIGKLEIITSTYEAWVSLSEDKYTYGYPNSEILHVQLYDSGAYKINGHFKESYQISGDEQYGN